MTVIEQTRPVLAYRFQRVLEQSWGTCVAIVLVLAIIGGAGLASLVTARETADSYSTLLAQSNPAQLNVTIFAPDISKRLDQIPGVRSVEGSLYSMAVFSLTSKGPVEPAGLASGNVTPLGSIGGEYFDQDRVSVIAGRLANPKRPDEFVATAAAEKLLHWHVGQRIEMGFYDDVSGASTSPTALKHPAERYDETLVGTVVFYDDLSQDEVDRYPTWLLFTPVVTATLNKGAQYIDYALQLKPGVTVTSVEKEFIKALPAGVTYTFHTTAYDESQVNLSVVPEALALGIFGVLALLSAFLVALQITARQLRMNREQREVLRALGASQITLIVDAICAVVASSVIGSFLAIGVSLLSSPLSPIGPVRPVLGGHYHVNSSVLLPGLAILLVATILGATGLAWRSIPGRRAAPYTSVAKGSRLARLGATAGLPASAVAGLHFAFDADRGRRSTPIRSVLVGVALAVTLLGTTLTFGAGLSTLVAHPKLYGWNWNYAMTATGGGVAPQSLTALSKSPYVAAWSPVSFGDVQINGQTVPADLEPSNARVSPPLLSGHDVRNKHQIVVGEATLAALHKRVGQTVVLSYGTKADAPAYVPPSTVTIVGTATLPAIGRSQVLHTSMGIGAVLDSGVITGSLHAAILQNLVVSDIDTVLVRMRPSATRAQGRTAMHGAAVAGNKVYAALPDNEGEGVSMEVLPVQYPAEIINYRSIGDTPLLLAMGFAVGVIAALASSVIASVRRRRRDLALLKTLGFTRRQLGACIVWQSSASVIAGLIVGIPAGIVCGRWLWTTFAHQIYAVPLPTIPTRSLAALCVIALVLANVVAFFPGRSAARTSAAILLRAE